MSTNTLPYNLSIPSSASVFYYQPFRDGNASVGWNSSWTRLNVADLFPSNYGGPAGNGIGVGAPYRTTTMDAATVQISFEGTAIYLCFRANGGAGKLKIDDAFYSTTADVVDPACMSYDGQPDTLLYADVLTYGPHVAVFEVETGAGNSQFELFGATVTIDAGAPVLRSQISSMITTNTGAMLELVGKCFATSSICKKGPIIFHVIMTPLPLPA